jgi:hypothetical protein
MSKFVTGADEERVKSGVKAAEKAVANVAASGREWGTAYLRWVRQQWDAAVDATANFQEAVVPKSLLEEAQNDTLASEYRNAARRSVALAVDSAALYAVIGTKLLDQWLPTPTKTAIIPPHKIKAKPNPKPKRHK